MVLGRTLIKYLSVILYIEGLSSYQLYKLLGSVLRETIWYLS